MTPPPLPPKANTPTGLKVSYSLTRGDIFHWQLYALVRNRMVLVFGLLAGLFTAWSNWHTPEMAGKSVAFKVFFALILTGMAFGFVGIFTLLALCGMVMFKKFRGFLGGHELEIRDDGLVERTDVNESLHRWLGFHKVVQTRRYLYIYVTDHNVHIVPRKCFASAQAEQAFRDELDQRIQLAREAGPRRSQ